MASLTVNVVSPEKTVFSGEANGMVAPAWDGKVGILPGHAPMIALLGAGELSITGSGGVQTFQVAGGLIKVEGNRVTVLTEYASDEAPSAALLKQLLGTASEMPESATSPAASA